MSAFLIALIAAALASVGARDQRLTAALAERLGKSTGLLLTGWLVCALTCGAAAWAGSAMSGLLTPPAKQMLAAIALALAAAEMLWPRAEREPEEPTRSLVAYAIVLAARQIGDGARFLTFAIAIAYADPMLAAAGGAIGSGAALALGWSLAGGLPRLRGWRIALALVLLLTGLTVAAVARGVVG